MLYKCYKLSKEGGAAVSKQNKVLIVIFSLMVTVFITVAVIGFASANPPAPDTTPTEGGTAPAETTPTAPKTDFTTTLSFIGDCIFGNETGTPYEGNFLWYAEQKPHDYFFSEVYDELSKDDLTFANFECVLTDRDLEKSYKDYDPAFWFRAPASYADILSLGSVEVAGIVNNHIYDFGDEGYADTVAALTAQNIAVGEELKPLYFDVNGLRIGAVYVPLWASYQTSYTLDVLEEMQSNCDYKIVFFHGGEEAIHEPDNYKITACRKIAESDLCDLIVGCHPHVLQPMEVVNGVPIVYSLGNFCYSGSNYPENKTIIFQVMLTQKEGGITTSTRIIPCYVFTGDRNNWQPAIVEHVQDYNEIIEMMNTPVDYKVETTASEETTAAATEAPTETPPQQTEAPITDPPEESFY